MTLKQEAILLVRNLLLDAVGPTVPLQVQNRLLSTTPSTTWVRETYLPVVSQFTDGVCERVEAIYRIDFFSPVGAGLETVNALVSQVKDSFYPRNLSNGPAAVTIYRAQELPSQTAEEFIMTPLHIYIRFFTPYEQT